MKFTTPCFDFPVLFYVSFEKKKKQFMSEVLTIILIKCFVNTHSTIGKYEKWNNGFDYIHFAHHLLINLLIRYINIDRERCWISQQLRINHKNVAFPNMMQHSIFLIIKAEDWKIDETNNVCVKALKILQNHPTHHSFAVEVTVDSASRRQWQTTDTTRK